MAQSGWTIRRANPDDARSIVRLIAQFWTNLGGNEDGLTTLYETRMQEGVRLAWLLTTSTKIIAATVVDPKDSRHQRMIATGAGDLRADAVLEYMVVDESDRGRGAGRLLQEHVLADLRGIGTALVALDVECDNEDAAAFWTRAGWVYQVDEPNPGSSGRFRRVYTKDLTTELA